MSRAPHDARSRDRSNLRIGTTIGSSSQERQRSVVDGNGEHLASLVLMHAATVRPSYIVAVFLLPITRARDR